MGKRNAAKRMKTASEVNTSAWFEETGRVRGPRLQAIDGGRSWHPDDADQKQYKRAATAPEGDRAQRYQKNVKPRSENQARLMEAMDEYALVAALGQVPARQADRLRRFDQDEQIGHRQRALALQASKV